MTCLHPVIACTQVLISKSQDQKRCGLAVHAIFDEHHQLTPYCLFTKGLSCLHPVIMYTQVQHTCAASVQPPEHANTGVYFLAVPCSTGMPYPRQGNVSLYKGCG